MIAEVSPEAFEALVADALASIPVSIQERIQNVVILVADDVSDRQRAELELSREDDLLGLFEGLTRGEESGAPAYVPATITLFRWPLLDASETHEQLVQEIRDTLWHEIAHYLGMDEEEVRREEHASEGIE